MNSDRQSAFVYLTQQLEQINSELRETERRLEALEDNANFSGADIRYKRLTDKYTSLNQNAIDIRNKIAEYLTMADNNGGMNNNGSVHSSSTGSSEKTSGSKRKSNAMSVGNQQISLQDARLIRNKLAAVGEKPSLTLNSAVIATVPDAGVTAVLDRNPNTMQIDSNEEEDVVFVPHSSRSSNNALSPSLPSPFPSTNAIVGHWPSLSETVFRHAQVTDPVPPTPSSFALPTTATTSSGIEDDGNTAVASESTGNSSNGGKNAKKATSLTQCTVTTAATGDTDATEPVLQTDEYVEMKKTIARMMRDFHDKKLHFIAVDGSPVFAHQYQIICQRLKIPDNTEKITDFLKGNMISYVTGIDKKKQTLTVMELFYPEHQLTM